MKLFKKSTSPPVENSDLKSLKSALQIAHIGSWKSNPNGSMEWDAITADLIGANNASAEDLVTDFLVHLKDDDHERFLDALEASSIQNKPFHQHLTITKGNAVIRHVQMIGSQTADDGTLTGICMDAPNASEKTDLDTESTLENFFDRSKVMMAELDLDGTFLRANAAWEQFLGIRSNQLIGRSLLDFLHPDSLPNTKMWLKQLNQRQSFADVRPSAHGELSAQIHISGRGSREISWTWTADISTQRIFTITRDVTETYQEETELTQELERAQRSNTELESFASTASHDLREPLRMITSYLKLLQERYPEALDSRGRRYIDYASQGAERMRTLIDDLLAYSRIGKASNPHEAIAIDDVIAHAIDNLAVAIRKSEAEITVDINDALIVSGDPIRLTRLFQNLLGNAIKFQAPGQTPRVHVSFEDGAIKGKSGQCIIAVKDNGIGIDPDHKDILFNLFQRLNTREEYDGSGIGLSVCKKIAEQHSGQIWCHSIPNQGSTFFVSLKKANSETIRGV